MSGEDSQSRAKPGKRIKPLCHDVTLDSLIKAHIKEEPKKTYGAWQTDDIEDAMENFNGFIGSITTAVLKAGLDADTTNGLIVNCIFLCRSSIVRLTPLSRRTI